MTRCRCPNLNIFLGSFKREKLLILLSTATLAQYSDGIYGDEIVVVCSSIFFGYFNVIGV